MRADPSQIGLFVVHQPRLHLRRPRHLDRRPHRRPDRRRARGAAGRADRQARPAGPTDRCRGGRRPDPDRGLRGRGPMGRRRIERSDRLGPRRGRRACVEALIRPSAASRPAPSAGAAAAIPALRRRSATARPVGTACSASSSARSVTSGPLSRGAGGRARLSPPRGLGLALGLRAPLVGGGRRRLPARGSARGSGAGASSGAGVPGSLASGDAVWRPRPPVAALRLVLQVLDGALHELLVGAAQDHARHRHLGVGAEVVGGAGAVGAELLERVDAVQSRMPLPSTKSQRISVGRV